MALDIIESKISKSPIFKAKRKAPTNICKIFFLNKGVEFTNVPSTFHEPLVKVCLLNYIKFDYSFVYLDIIYAIRSKRFNFNKILVI